ncbi:hypothetical protein J6590_096328, partial [Homalodisca vitripennis]
MGIGSLRDNNNNNNRKQTRNKHSLPDLCETTRLPTNLHAMSMVEPANNSVSVIDFIKVSARINSNTVVFPILALGAQHSTPSMTTNMAVAMRKQTMANRSQSDMIGKCRIHTRPLLICSRTASCHMCWYKVLGAFFLLTESIPSRPNLSGDEPQPSLITGGSHSMTNLLPPNIFFLYLTNDRTSQLNAETLSL